jgi:hypothetical protein
MSTGYREGLKAFEAFYEFFLQKIPKIEQKLI